MQQVSCFMSDMTSFASQYKHTSVFGSSASLKRLLLSRFNFSHLQVNCGPTRTHGIIANLSRSEARVLVYLLHGCCNALAAAAVGMNKKVVPLQTR